MPVSLLRRRQARVDFEVRLPRWLAGSASLRNGEVRLKNVGGKTRLVTHKLALCVSRACVGVVLSYNSWAVSPEGLIFRRTR